MESETDATAEEGRPLRLTPVQPGFWMVVIGGSVMVLGPLFGLLAGSMLGMDDETLGMSPIYFFLFVGFVVAGLGLGLLLLGARRLWRHLAQDREQTPG
jgi:hypothetical protein